MFVAMHASFLSQVVRGRFFPPLNVEAHTHNTHTHNKHKEVSILEMPGGSSMMVCTMGP